MTDTSGIHMSNPINKIELVDVSFRGIDVHKIFHKSKYEVIVGLINSGIDRIHLDEIGDAGIIHDLCVNKSNQSLLEKCERSVFLCDLASVKELDSFLSTDALQATVNIAVSESFVHANKKIIEPHRETEIITALSKRTRKLPRNVSVNIETGFDCPFGGKITVAKLLAKVDKWARGGFPVEFCICDTTGYATPDRVSEVFHSLHSEFGSAAVNFSFFPNNTFGFGLSNLITSYRLGVRTFVTSLGGFCNEEGGYVHQGNLATEDVTFLFEKMSMPTNIDLEGLLAVVDRLAYLKSEPVTKGYVGNLSKSYVLNKVRRP